MVGISNVLNAPRISDAHAPVVMSHPSHALKRPEPLTQAKGAWRPLNQYGQQIERACHRGTPLNGSFRHSSVSTMAEHVLAEGSLGLGSV